MGRCLYVIVACFDVFGLSLATQPSVDLALGDFVVHWSAENELISITHASYEHNIFSTTKMVRFLAIACQPTHAWCSHSCKQAPQHGRCRTGVRFLLPCWRVCGSHDDHTGNWGKQQANGGLDMYDGIAQ